MRFAHAESANGLAFGNRFPKQKNSAACQRRPSRLPPARTSPQALLMTTPAATMPNRSKPFTIALRGLSTKVLQKAFQSRLKIVTVFQLSPMYVLLVPLQALPSESDKTETNKHIKNRAPNRPQEANRIAHHYEYGQRHSKPHGKD